MVLVVAGIKERALRCGSSTRVLLSYYVLLIVIKIVLNYLLKCKYLLKCITFQLESFGLIFK